MKLHTFHAPHPLRKLSYLALLGISLPGLGLLTGCDQRPATAPTTNTDKPKEDIQINTPGAEITIDRNPADGKSGVDVDVNRGGTGVDVEVDRTPGGKRDVDVEVKP